MLIVEDGTNDNANSYCSLEELKDFFSTRNYQVSLSDKELESMVILSMDYLETLDYIGRKRHTNQSLMWPRYGDTISTSTVIPVKLKNALCQLVYELSIGNDISSNTSPVIKREKFDVIDTEYDTTSFSSKTKLTKVDNFLSGLIKNHGLIKAVRV